MRGEGENGVRDKDWCGDLDLAVLLYGVPIRAAHKPTG